MKFIQYEHHGELVWMMDELKGKHRENCLCYHCLKFVPEDREKNCKIANDLYDNCIKYSLTTPVYECKEFEYT